MGAARSLFKKLGERSLKPMGSAAKEIIARLADHWIDQGRSTSGSSQLKRPGLHFSHRQPVIALPARPFSARYRR
jgi:hypothetical protein